MTTVETISIVFTGLSISLAAFYYISTLRNTQRNQQLQLETRQISTYIQTLGFRDPNFMKAWGDVMYIQEFNDYEDWLVEYGVNNNLEAWSNFCFICNTFQSIGLLVERGILEPDIVYDQEGELIMRSWERMSPIIEGMRGHRQYVSLFDHYESLYNRMVKIREQLHPELKT
jgi:hypothetical protein